MQSDPKLLLRPLWGGLKELILRRTLRSAPVFELYESEDADLFRFRRASWSRPLCGEVILVSSRRFRAGDRERERERFVDIVETESEDDVE
jgi:hypothetical protein